MAKPDEVMAEYLLKGGKMLARDCTACGCPLFEYKGETFCVVCRKEKEERSARGEGGESGPSGPVSGGTSREAEKPAQAPGGSPPGLTGAVGEALESAIVALCRRCEQEADPERCLVLMSAVRKGIEGLRLLDGA